MFSLINDKRNESADLADSVLLSLFEVIHEAALILYPDGRVQRANLAAADLLQSSTNALQGRTVVSLFAEDTDPLPGLPRREQGASYQPRSQEQVQLVTGSGHMIEVQMSGCMIVTPAGKDVAAILVFEDQRAATRISSQLAATELQLHQALDAAEEGAWSADITTGIAKVSGRFAAMLDLPAANETRLHMVQLLEKLHPDDVGLVRGRMTALSKGTMNRFDDEIRLKTPDGGYRWVRNRGRIVEHDAQGKARRAAGLVRDIDAHKRMEVRAVETESLFREAMLAVRQTLWTTDFESGVVRVEGPLVGRLGRAGQSMVMTRERFRDLVHPADLKRSTELWEDVVDSGDDSYEFTGRMVDAQGELFPVHVLARVAVRGPQNRPLRATGIVQILDSNIDSADPTSQLAS